MHGGLRVYTLPGLRCRHGLRARVLLEDGVALEGCGFGAAGTRVGEVVFTTAMTGYPESLTDPSYRGQILVATHPLIGNYGVPSRRRRVHGIPLDYESDRVQVEAFIVAEATEPSHHASEESLHEWLEREGVPGVYRVDTRFLVEHIREHGVLMGVVSVYPEDGDLPGWGELEGILKSSPRYDDLLLAPSAGPREPVTHTPEGRVRGRVSMLDCGVKYGILRSLLERGLEVTRYPCTAEPSQLLDGYDGVVLSSGPGNPALLRDQARTAAEVASSGKPVLAVCLGMQLLALGLGAEIYKLPYGHRSVNKPVVDLETGRCMITTHNHGYAVDWDGLEGTGLKPWFKQPDDGTLEGVKTRDGLVLATQFHPEAGPGPWDAKWVFDRFAGLVESRGGRA
ncbi:glutamine-hydrolyzing carbamoyl-phosphate synthase small subunit [Stetteria hydrogenophila]